MYETRHSTLVLSSDLEMTFQNICIRENNVGKRKLILTKIYCNIAEI
jgi:hypothetical protein